MGTKKMGVVLRCTRGTPGGEASTGQQQERHQRRCADALIKHASGTSRAFEQSGVHADGKADVLRCRALKRYDG